MSLVLCVALLGSVSGMTLAGPRIPFVMAEDYPVFKALLRRNRRGSPFVAVALQSTIALVLVLSGTFEAILTYIGFALSLCTCLTVAGIFVVRARESAEPASYRCWGYPVTPILFLALNLWMLVFILWQRPVASALGLLTICTGVPLYFYLRRRAAAPPSPIPGTAAHTPAALARLNPVPQVGENAPGLRAQSMESRQQASSDIPWTLGTHARPSGRNPAPGPAVCCLDVPRAPSPPCLRFSTRRKDG